MAPFFLINQCVHRDAIEEILSLVKDQLTNSSPVPCLVRSDTGVGESTIVISKLTEWYLGEDHRVLVISCNHMTAGSTAHRLWKFLIVVGDTEIRILDPGEFGRLTGRNRITGPCVPRVYPIEEPADLPTRDYQFCQRLPGRVQLAARLFTGKTIKRVLEPLRPSFCSAVAALCLLNASRFEETGDSDIIGPFDCVLNTAIRTLEFLRFAFLYQAQIHPALLKDSRNRADFDRRFGAWLMSGSAGEILAVRKAIQSFAAQLSSMEEFISRRLYLHVFQRISEERIPLCGRQVSMTVYSSVTDEVGNRKVHIFGGAGLPVFDRAPPVRL